MLKTLIWKIRRKFFTRIEPNLMQQNPKFEAFEIGEKTYGNPEVLFSDSGAKLQIGKYVSIADGVAIMLGGEHRVDWPTTYPFNKYYPEWAGIEGHPATKGDVTIGNDVWIGNGAILLSGITVGDGAVIGARSVVAKNVDPYSIVVGNPARHVRFRFDSDVIQEIQNMRWWDWPDDTIRQAVPRLMSSDVTALIEFYQTRVKSSALRN